jgi:hypothetical protein
MSTLKPFNKELSSDEFLRLPDEDTATEILREVGVINSKPSKQDILSNAKNLFDTSGAGVAEAAKTVAGIMKFGDSDSSRLNAAKLALQVGEVFKELDLEDTTKKSPVVNIIIAGADNNTMINLLTPK